MSHRMILVICTVLLAVFWIAALSMVGHYIGPKERRVDCGLAEFHPDITPKERQMCRERRSVKL